MNRMIKQFMPLAIGIALATSLPAQARSTFETATPRGGELPAVLQCVPYARQLTGVQIYGDAHTWWGQAAGRYQRSNRPTAGSVMAVRPHANSRLGHVAAVERVLDSRTVLISHANWSERGKIERNVRAVDVSEANDWSKVRIWHGPSQTLGTTHWPLYGFIHGSRPRGPSPSSRPVRASAKPASTDFIADIIAGRVQ